MLLQNKKVAIIGGSYQKIIQKQKRPFYTIFNPAEEIVLRGQNTFQ
jgi:hypothetical protein